MSVDAVAEPDRDRDERWMVIDERRWTFVQMDTRLLADRDVDSVAQSVYNGLSWHANRSDEAWPSIATLAGYACVSANRARQGIRALITAGYITERARAGQSNAYVLVDLRKGPRPPGPSPWGTPPDPGGVDQSGPRDYSPDLGGPPGASQGPQARDYSPPEGSGTPSDPEGVLSTAPSDPGGDPSTTWRGSSTQNQRTTPLPPAGFAAPSGRRSRRSPGQGLSRGQNQAPAPKPAVTAARDRAITLARNQAGLIRAGDMTRDDLSTAVRTECRKTGLLDRVETEQVVQAALTTVDEVLTRGAQDALAAVRAAAPTPVEGDPTS